MPDANKTLIISILDRSGSMSTIKTDMEGGFNTFIKDQKDQPGECSVTLCQFDTEYEVVYENKPIGEVPPLILTPRGSTALLDAVGLTINRVGAQLAALPEEQRPGAVIVKIITDGQENASKEYSRSQVQAMIKTQTESFNWQFLYLGSDINTLKDARDLGIAQAAVYTANAAGVKGMYSSVSEASLRHRRAVRGGDLSAKIDLGNNKKS